MNAVKRCLALIAATVVIGACGGDPTADLAGTGLKIRATPGTVWMYHSKPTTVLIEAVDATGAPQPGSWTATASGPLSVTFDSTFQPTNTGTLRISSRYVISASSEGNGTVIFAGTGGADTVRVRVAPDTFNFQVTFTSPTQVGDTVTVPLNAPVSVTAPAGIRFTSGTAVTVATGTTPRDTALFRPISVSVSADSQSLTFTPGPNGTGQVRITGVASVQTPKLTSVARTGAIIKTDQFDTAGSTRLVLSTTTPAIGQNITVTLPPEYRFSPNSGVSHITDSLINGAVKQIVTNGLAAPVVVSVSADSGTLVYTPAPAARGQPRFTNIRVRENATAFVFAARSASSYTVPAMTSVAATISSTSPAANTAITLTMPAQFKFRPTSTFTQPGSILNPVVISIAADSNSAVILPAPGASGPITITNIQFAPLASLTLTLPTSTSVTVGAAPNLAQDDPKAGAVALVQGPTGAGNVVSIYDQASLGAADYTNDAGPTGKAQYLRVHANYTGSVAFNFNWTGGTSGNTDMDYLVVNDDGSYATKVAGCTPSAATGSKPEATVCPLVSGTNYIVAQIDFGVTGFDGPPFTGLPAGSILRVTMTGQ